MLLLPTVSKSSTLKDKAAHACHARIVYEMQRQRGTATDPKVCGTAFSSSTFFSFRCPCRNLRPAVQQSSRACCSLPC